MDDFDFDEYITEDTEMDLENDFDIGELDEGYVWHPSALDSYEDEHSF